MEQSHSIRLIKKRKEFETSRYRSLLKKIYYMGKPLNGRTEYFALETLALTWIVKTIGYKFVSDINLLKRAGNNHQRILPNGVICLDKINLFWETTFLLEDECIWFIGPATVSDTSVSIKTSKYNVVICRETPSEYEISTNECIKFCAPVPLLESVRIVEEFGTNSIYITKFNWNNSKVQKANITENYRTIEYTDYVMYIYDLHELIAIITPLHKK